MEFLQHVHVLILAYNGKTTCLPVSTHYNSHLDNNYIRNKEIFKN